MKKRVLKFIGTFLLGMIYVLTFLRAQTANASMIELRYANFPAPTTFPCVQMERWAKEVEKRTGGKVKVKTFPGGTLLDAKGMFDGVVAGLADIGCFCPSYHPGMFPLLEAMDLPIGWPNTKVASLTLLKLYQKWQPKELEKVKVLTMFTCAPMHIASKIPIKNLADLKGVELRAAGASVPYLKALGATPVGMPMSDVPEALQKGLIKGYLSSIEVLKDYKFAEYCRHVTYLGDSIVTFAVIMNKKSWESLPKDVQKLFDNMAEEQSLWTGTYMDDYIKEVIDWTINTYKVQYYSLPESDIAKKKELIKPLFDDYLARAKAKGIPADEVLKDIFALRDEMSKKYPEIR